MSYRREHRSSRSALFDDGLEEGGLPATTSNASSYFKGIDDDDNDKLTSKLQDRVNFLKKITGDIHEEVETQNRMLDKMGNGMDISRGVMAGTVERFKMVFAKKSSRRTCLLAGIFVASFLIIYCLIRLLSFFMVD